MQLVEQIPWKHNIILMQKIKDKNIRKWYIEKVIEEGWVESVLLYQLDTNLYMRQVENKKHNNFEITLKENSELANHIMKEPYVFDLIVNNNKFIMYTTEDGQVEIEVRLEDENVWLIQNSMTELFDTTRNNITMHIKNMISI